MEEGSDNELDEPEESTFQKNFLALQDMALMQ
jgi:hypothetical protein